MSALRSLLMLTCLSLTLGACGYGTQSSLDLRYRNIHVAAFKNESREYDLQGPFTNAVIRKFLNDGRLRVVNPGQADLILEGTILDYELKGILFDEDDDVTQFLTNMTISVTVSDTQTGEILWQDRRLISETSFLTTPTPAASERQRGNAEAFVPTVRSFRTSEENRAASEVIEQLASDIFYRTIEPW